jgi:hypothetical protein
MRTRRQEKSGVVPKSAASVGTVMLIGASIRQEV